VGATVGRETDAVAFLAALAETPYRFDFYQTLRRLENMRLDQPRWGEAQRPGEESVRFGQQPELSFAPAPLAAFEPGREGGPPRLRVRLFGLLGPNGPLPLHMTEYVRERLRDGNDPTLRDFLDIFHHRFLTLFYRAWAQAQPPLSRDRPDDDRFSGYIGALFGIFPATLRNRDVVPDLAKLFHAGALTPQACSADGLAAILEQFFRVPVQIHEFVGHWLPLAVVDRTTLGRANARLGSEAVLGEQVWDRQHKFRISLGPLTLSSYRDFLPSAPLVGDHAPALDQLVDWVRLYLSFELAWDVQLVLRQNEVPPLVLGRGGQLGWTTWLGKRQSTEDAGDLCLNAEAFVTAAGVAVQ
jgi:type VI secretion system protein ImpH